MTSEAVTTLSIRQYQEKTNEDGETERGPYYALTGTNAVGKPTTLQVPPEVLREALGRSDIVEEQVKAILEGAQEAFDAFIDDLAAARADIGVKFQAFQRTLRQTTGLRPTPAAQRQEDEGQSDTNADATLGVDVDAQTTLSENDVLV